jgi:maleylacetate reductase
VKSFVHEALPVRVVFGVGSLASVGEETERLGASRVVLIAGGHEKAFADVVAAALGPRLAGRFEDVQPHVPLAVAETARSVARELRADALVSIGGGSATGLAKAVALDTGLPIVAVPTTYAGSEMTTIYGITSDSRKQTGRDPRVLPKTVLYDPALTVTLPPGLSAASGMNALAHCVEATYAEGANPLRSAIAGEGIRALAAGLPVVVRAPDDLDARGEVLLGAWLAGTVLASGGVGIHHKICHVLGGTFGLSHAETHAVVLPHVVAFNAGAAPAALALVARALGHDDPAAAIFDLGHDSGLPSSLAALGMPEDGLDEAARLVVAAAPPNPRPVDEAGVRALLADAFSGRRPRRQA